MPLAEVLQALSRTPKTQAQLRAALATTCARWQLLSGEADEAIRQLAHALEMVPDLRPAMRLLYRIYLDRGDVRSAVMYLDQEIRATRHPREAAALYRERGQLVEAHFHDLGAAQQCYQAALKATPRDLAVLRSVERVLLGRGDVFWLAENLEAQLEVVQDEKTVAGLLHELSLIEARHKGDLALAGDMMLHALEQLPAHAVLAADLFRIAEASGDAALMLGALEAEAEGRDEAHRALPLARASVVLREQRERGAALELLRSAARTAPHNFSLWRNLEELAMATSRHEVAAEACIGQLRAIGDEGDDPTRAELYYRLGKLALFRLERPQEGLAAMRRALRLSPGHPPTLEDTGRYLNAGQMWSQQLEFVNLEIAAAGETGLTREELAQCHLRGGQIMEEQLGEYEGARRAYREATGAAPAFRPPRDRLERVLHHIGDTDGLKRYYAEELEQAQTPSRRAFLRSALGQLHSGDTDPSEAIEYLQANVDESEKQPSIQLLARLLARAGRTEELLAVTELEIEQTASPVRRAKLMHRAGELALAQGDIDRARSLFEGALEAVDDHLPSLEALGRLLRSEGDWNGLVDLLRKELLYANDRTRQVGLQLEVANLLSSRLGRDEDALLELQALLRRWPRHLPALHAAERIAARLGKDDLQLSLLEQHTGAVGGPRTRALLLHRAARIRARNGDTPGAIRDLVRALELWPQLGVARAQLLRMYEQGGRVAELQAFAEAGLAAERGTSNRRAMALQLAEIAPSPVVALQYLGPLVETDGGDLLAQLRLARASQHAARPSRQAGALAGAADALAADADPAATGVVSALRYRAARAEEAAGNLDEADQAYARVLDADPSHVLAQRGRKRIAARKRELAEARDLDDLLQRADAVSGPSRAALLNMAAELHERRLDLAAALGLVDRALEASADYTPALHARARLLERIGNDEALTAATEALEELARRAREPKHAAAALCRAGTLALRAVERDNPNPRAWALFSAAASADPQSTRALRGLIRTRKTHGLEGAQPLAEVLPKCVAALQGRGDLDARTLREIGQLSAEVDGPAPTIALLTAGLPTVDADAGLLADLAQAHAQAGDWPAVVQALEGSLEHEPSPERRAALHYYAGEAYERTGSANEAVVHFIDAGKGGFHAPHALRSAARLAEAAGLSEAHAQALELLVDATTGRPRSQALHALARLNRGPLGQPQRAVEQLRDLLQMAPTDTVVIGELRDLLAELDRADEGAAVLLAGVAHHRSWLRSGNPDALDSAPLEGLRRLFGAMGHPTGVYLTACSLETLSPGSLGDGQRPDDLQAERWPLPSALEGRPLESIAADLDHSGALDLLREGAYYFGSLPFDPATRKASDALPPNNAVVMVARSLASALGLPTPLVFFDESIEDGARTSLSPAPCLMVGRRIAANPADPAVRDVLGRALFRLATGGDAVHAHANDTQLLTLVFTLCRATGQDIDHLLGIERFADAFDPALSQTLAAALPDADTLEDIVDFARAFANNADRFYPSRLHAGFTAGQDRAGAVCAGDPRPALSLAMNQGPIVRVRALISYLVSDDHLNLRRALGYHLGANS
jgi:tetratricopeptide (TPR) repeat protein